MTWYDDAFYETFSDFDRLVDPSLFHFLANISAPTIRLTGFAIPLAKQGCTLANLKKMSKRDLTELGSSVGMDAGQIRCLVDGIVQPTADPRFEFTGEVPMYPFQDWTPAYSDFRKEVEEVFHLADADGNGVLDFEELQFILRDPDFAKFLLSNEAIDRDKSGTLDVFEWQDVLHPIWVQNPEAAKFIVDALRNSAQRVR